MPRKQKTVDCPEYNLLLRYCQLLNGLCTSSKKPLDCGLRPDYKPVPSIKREKPVKPVEKPADHSLAAQLRELGLEPSHMESLIDKMGIMVELETIQKTTPSDLIHRYRPEPEVYPEFKDGIEFTDDGQCLAVDYHHRMWRYNIKGKTSDWVCDWCHPSLNTPSRQVWPPLDGKRIRIKLTQFIPGHGYVKIDPTPEEAAEFKRQILHETISLDEF